MQQILNETKVVLAAAGVVAGTDAVATDIIDMQGFDSIVFVASAGTYNAGNYMTVQQDDANSTASMADLEGSKCIFPASGKTAMIEVYKPCKRYVRAVVTRGASTTVGDIYALLSSKIQPPNNDVASTTASTIVISPAEGTA